MFAMGDQKLAALFREVKTIAIVGAKDAPSQPVDMVGRYLIAIGYEVIPVHPKRKNVWGLTTYSRLADVPKPIDMVNLFRASQFCLEHAKETLALSHRPLSFWMQLGIRSPEARAILEPAGISVIEDACLMVEHRRLMGKAV